MGLDYVLDGCWLFHIHPKGCSLCAFVVQDWVSHASGFCMDWKQQCGVCIKLAPLLWCVLVFRQLGCWLYRHRRLASPHSCCLWSKWPPRFLWALPGTQSLSFPLPLSLDFSLSLSLNHSSHYPLLLSSGYWEGPLSGSRGPWGVGGLERHKATLVDHISVCR